MSRASLTEANAITGKPLDFFRDDYLVPSGAEPVPTR